MDSQVYVIGRDGVPQYLRLEAGESCAMTLVVPPGTDTLLTLEVDLAGPRASLDLAGLYLCRDHKTVLMNGKKGDFKSLFFQTLQ